MARPTSARSTASLNAGGAAPGPHRGGGRPDGQARHYAHTARRSKGWTRSTSGHQPSLDKKQVETLSTWPSASRVKAIERGYRVLFTTAAGLIASLTRALTEGRLEEPLELYTVPRLLLFDEIGYLPIDRAGANLFFQLISRCYERGQMILTRNQSFGS